MKSRTFYMVAEIQHADDGRLIPRRYISGPYAEYLLARQVKDVLGDGYHVCEYDQVRSSAGSESQP